MLQKFSRINKNHKTMPIKRNFSRTATIETISASELNIPSAAPDYIIAIDPDTDKSGVAMLNPRSRILDTESLTFPMLIDKVVSYAQICRNKNMSLVVIVEAGYLNRSNWHLTDCDSRARASAKGNSTGRNHEVARKIIEMCRHHGVEVVEQRPLRKTWQGRDGKITHKELASFVGQLEGRTNQEERDAALIAWSYANLPIIVKKK